MMPLNSHDGVKVAPRRDKVIEIPELNGPIRLMQLSARVTLKSRALHLRATKDGENIEEEQTLLLIMNGLVDGAGKPLFPTVETATAFLDQISAAAYSQILAELSDLLKDPSAEANPSTPNTSAA